MARLGIGLLATFLWAGPAAFGQQTIYVNAATGDDTWDGLCEEWDGGTCGPKRTIQAGIDATGDGDTVIVADGTYTGDGNRDLDFGGRAITVRSENGPETCIIDCEDDGRGFYFHAGEGVDSLVDGFMIRNGSADHGGGVYCYYSSNPTITNCTISGNSATLGGGVHCLSSNPTITNCTISENSATLGGGVHCWLSSSPMITNCTISENSAGAGGGVCCYYSSSPTITNCTISENSASHGGGVYCYDNYENSPTITNCTITGNSADHGGGGLYCKRNYFSSTTITNCTISENSADVDGGGVYGGGDSPTIINCTTISGNSATYGGAVYCQSSSPTITNCTISGNSAYLAGGVLCLYSSYPTITNCILWDDTPPEIYVYATSAVVTYSDVQGGWDGEGNIDADPQFAFEDDQHLMPSSPCIDAGTNSPPGGLPAEDPDGNPRPLDGDGDASAVADMGAYEFNLDAPSIALSPTHLTFYGPQGGLNPGDQVLSIRNCGGATLSWQVVEDCSWLSVFPTSGQSVGEVDEVTLSVDTSGMVWGEYRCALEVSDAAAVNSPRWATVTLYVNQTLHVPAEYPTIQTGIDATVDGDTVIVGDGTYTGDGNKDLDFGGKVITVRSANGPDNCIIDCEGSGRGFYFHAGEGVDSVVDGFTIRNGSADFGGGVYCSDWSSPTITNCMISENSAERHGGGVYCYSHSSPTITNCTISENSLDYYYGTGGGVYCSSSSPTITNCTIGANSADYRGGGVYCSGGSPTITNCILWNDTPEEIYVVSGSPIVTYCDVQGGWDGEGNIDADPQFAFEGDQHLMVGSPCIDAGTNSPPGGLPAYDPDGNPRPLDGDGDASAVADMGTYEFNLDAPSIALSPIELSFYGPQGGLNPDDQVLCIRNCGGATLSWQVVEDCSWLSVFPSSGQSVDEVDEVTLSVDTSGMVWDEYSCVLEVSDAAAINSPRWATVTLYVNQTLHVPAEYATIQDAIDAAVAGDEIVVCEGVYTGSGNKDLDFGGKVITVRSANGPDSCIIDCEGTGRGFYFHTGEGPDSVVDGFTIRNGSADFGGGVCCSDWSSPTITNCTISGNWADDGGGISCRNSSPSITNCTISGNWGDADGGGVHCYYSSPSITNCTISGNWADDGGGISCRNSSPTITNCTISENSLGHGGDAGGGVYCDSSSLTVTKCTISANSADVGGGVYCLFSSPTIINCTISENSADEDGAGVYCYYSSPPIINCTINMNSAERHGGGVHSYYYSSPTITNCTISENSAERHGAGVYSYYYSSPTITNCTISGNSLHYYYGTGGGVYCSFSSPTISNCTITANSADYRAGGVYCQYGSSPAITNCILWNDTPEEIYVASGSPVVTYCDVQGGWAGEGNIDADPLFVDPLSGDYHLSADSPCIDTGDPNFVPPAGETDIDGQARVWDGDGDGFAVVDMGADEFGSFVYGDLNCDDAVNGFDIDPFLLAITDAGEYETAYPACSRLLADLNADGVVNEGDIDAFVEVLTGG